MKNNFKFGWGKGRKLLFPKKMKVFTNEIKIYENDSKIKKIKLKDALSVVKYVEWALRQEGFEYENGFVNFGDEKFLLIFEVFSL